MMRTLPLLLACTFLAESSVAQKTEDKPNEIAPFAFSIETVGGQKLDQDSFKGNVLLVDFWGTWCGPCRAAVPDLVSLYKKYKHHGLEIVGLNYQPGGGPEAKDKIRDFAIEQGITYTVAPGTAAIRNQILGFSGYPTMVFFKRGLEFDHIEVGYGPGHKDKIELWIREALGLDAEAPDQGKTTSGSADPGQSEKAPDATAAKKERVAAGAIYEPGDHDTGFGFTVKDLDGEEVEFVDYRGKTVVFALTTTWDLEADKTAAILKKIHSASRDKNVVVVAASLEMKSDRNEKVAAIKKFIEKHGIEYQVLPADLSFLAKIHKASGVPLYLVFDADGTLIHRQAHSEQDEVIAAIQKALEKA